MGTKLPRKLEQKMSVVGEQIKLARLRRNLSVSHSDQSLLVSSTSNKAELGILLDACEDYMLNRKTAKKIISEVIKAVKGWRELSNTTGGFQERDGYVCWSVGWSV